MALLNKILLIPNNGYCCINCNKMVLQSINESMHTHFFAIVSSFIILASIVAALVYLANKNYNPGISENNKMKQAASMPLTSAAMILGIGIGGFTDGIILHQILQWHEMLSGKLPPDNLLNKNVNMFWDGIFHLFTLAATAIGIYLLWKLLANGNLNKSGYLLVGGMLLGWGLFNLVEGIINHHVLELHNVREFSPDRDFYNYGFLLFSVLLLILGRLLIRKGQRKIFI